MRHWFCVRVRSKFDFVVRDGLRAAGVEEFCPVYATESRWSDRVAVVTRPLFPGYIFAKFDPEARDAILAIRGTVQILSIDSRPISIPDDEIADLRSIAEAPVPFVRVPYVAGAKVTIERGPFAGATSIISRVKGGTLLTLLVSIFGRPTPVQVEAADVKAAATEKKAL